LAAALFAEDVTAGAFFAVFLAGAAFLAAIRFPLSALARAACAAPSS
jgi:hypothetical protein